MSLLGALFKYKEKIMDIIKEIREKYVSFNAPRKRIAEYILNDPLKCSFLSLKEFSKNCVTSEVTILSFCKDLGLSNYIELKQNLKEYIFENNSPEERFKHYVSSNNGDAKKIYYDTVKSINTAVIETTRLNDFSKLSQGINLIRNAKKIFVSAHDASRIAAYYFKLRFSQLGCDVYVMEAESVAQNIAQLKRSNYDETVLVSIATPPYGKSTLAMTELCKSLNIPIISFTDSELSPLVKMSDVSFSCITAENFKGLTNSYSSFFCIIEILNLLYYKIEDCPDKDLSFHNLINKYYSSLKA